MKNQSWLYQEDKAMPPDVAYGAPHSWSSIRDTEGIAHSLPMKGRIGEDRNDSEK